MSTAIWKFTVPVPDPGSRGVAGVPMPRGACLMSVVNQNENLVVYALVNPKELQIDQRLLRVAVTGSDPGRVGAGKFLGTVLFDNGQFVLHVWDLGV